MLRVLIGILRYSQTVKTGTLTQLQTSCVQEWCSERKVRGQEDSVDGARYDIRRILDKWILLPAALVAASLLIAVCGGNDDDTASAPTVREGSVSPFPTHDRPLPTDWALGTSRLS